jgi:hypothetical protein
MNYYLPMLEAQFDELVDMWKGSKWTVWKGSGQPPDHLGYQPYTKRGGAAGYRKATGGGGRAKPKSKAKPELSASAPPSRMDVLLPRLQRTTGRDRKWFIGMLVDYISKHTDHPPLLKKHYSFPKLLAHYGPRLSDRLEELVVAASKIHTRVH